jgi:hypothetical protein
MLSQTSEKVADLFVYDRLVLSLTWAVFFTDGIAPKMASLREQSAKLSTLHASYIAE